MPTLSGIVETCLHVGELQRSIEFYRNLFGFQLMVSDARMAAFAVADKQVFLLFLKGASENDMPIEGGIIPGHGGDGRLHMAFAIPASELDGWRQRLAEQGIAITGTVHWPKGGVSLYFRDPDQHLIELATPGIWTVY